MKDKQTISDLLRQVIIESELPYQRVEKETGISRSSIQRFVDGRQSLRLDVADVLAEYFGLEVKRKKKGR